ncbi:DUF3892 domain-containing protein [Myroides odoratimimus]|uniref:DUF3892 domain-containing protein n=1 Tax=Myroides odoratimimus TaxID=76832 RepID=UPI002DB80825|nr:DUF3892 domain-containing protein [Myroides odoratimimus]MEC4036914.1 DUF3892 domain-containing protein [Myroides odoratimimus]
MKHFYITAIKYSNDYTHISQVLIHSSNEKGRLNKGKICNKNQIIELLEKGSIIETANYDYEDGYWKIGANVGIVTVDSKKYLRSDPDSIESDNLGNLLLIDEIR